eukprot:TRINITY_DN6762_c4_g1_i1.p1 TRINITY_DN6762_c4_g1~~TRINITY_DN6762_c4_g1_i1.p1  ORF type:complete len:530 (-),score=116.49 TRINITY_DN6762_c4_g1_i1:34-1623(-)
MLTVRLDVFERKYEEAVIACEAEKERETFAKHREMFKILSSANRKVDPMVMKMVFTGWQVEAQELVFLRKLQHLQQFQKVRAATIANEQADTILSATLAAAFVAWKSVPSLRAELRDKTVLSNVRRQRAREKHNSKAVVNFLSRPGGLVYREALMDFTRTVIGAWRLHVGILSLKTIQAHIKKNLNSQASEARKRLSSEKERLCSVLIFAEGSAVGLPSSMSAPEFAVAWSILRRLLPQWRRLAGLSSWSKRLRHREESNLRIVDRLRAEAREQQLQWAHWGALPQPRAAAYLEAMDWLQAWRLVVCKIRELRSGRDSYGRTTSLQAAESMLARIPIDLLRSTFFAWRRAFREEAVLSLEEQVRRLEARLARAAGEQALQLPEFEQRLAFQGDSDDEEDQTNQVAAEGAPATLPPPSSAGLQERRDLDLAFIHQVDSLRAEGYGEHEGGSRPWRNSYGSLSTVSEKASEASWPASAATLPTPTTAFAAVPGAASGPRPLGSAQDVAADDLVASFAQRLQKFTFGMGTRE